MIVRDSSVGADDQRGEDNASEPTSLSQQLFELAQSLHAEARELRVANTGACGEADALDVRAAKLEEKLVDIAAQVEVKRESVKHDKWLKEHEHYLAWHLENSRSIISMSQSSARLVATVNAGAAVALLAFLGNALAKDEHLIANRFAGPLLTFAIGVVIAALVGALSYVTQYLYGIDDPKKQILAKRLHLVTIVMWVASLGTFAGGCVETYFSVLSSVQTQEVATPTSKGADLMNQDLKKNAPPPVRPAAEPPAVQRPVSRPPEPKPSGKP
jgi:hypothetical protein